jgi:hypothetical protein
MACFDSQPHQSHFDLEEHEAMGHEPLIDAMIQ